MENFKFWTVFIMYKETALLLVFNHCLQIYLDFLEPPVKKASYDFRLYADIEGFENP